MFENVANLIPLIPLLNDPTVKEKEEKFNNVVRKAMVDAGLFLRIMKGILPIQVVFVLLRSLANIAIILVLTKLICRIELA